MIYKTLYHLDNNDNIRIWYMERDGSKHRTVSGILNGGLVESGWKQAEPTNVGRANHRDAEAQAEFEVEALYQKKLDRKYSLSPETAQRSNFLQPMLAATLDEKKTLKKATKWYFQPKFDGVRCVMDEDGGTSRAGKPFFTVNHLVEQVKEVSQKYNVTFDGELYNHEYREDFEALVSLIKKQKLSSLTDEQLKEIADKVQFHIYDIIFWDDLDRQYEARLDFLKGIFLEDFSTSTNIKLTESIPYESPTLEQVKEAHDKYFLDGYEGIMLRVADSVYENKRSKGLVKFKNFDEAEFPLVRMVEGTGNWAGAVKSVVLRLPNGDTSDAGVTGTYETNVERLKNEREYIEGDVTTLFQGYTKEGKLRFGRAKIFHKGKRDY